MWFWSTTWRLSNAAAPRCLEALPAAEQARDHGVHALTPLLSSLLSIAVSLSLCLSVSVHLAASAFVFLVCRCPAASLHWTSEWKQTVMSSLLPQQPFWVPRAGSSGRLWRG